MNANRPRHSLLLPFALSVLIMACGRTAGPGVLITLAPSSTPAPVGALTPARQQGAVSTSYSVEAGPGVPLDLLQRDGLRLGRAADGTPPVLSVALAGTGQGVPARYWVPVTGLFNDAVDISLNDLQRALQGEVTDWSSLGASPAPLRLLLPAEHLDELRLLPGEAGETLLPSAAASAGAPDAVATGVPTAMGAMTAGEIVAGAGLQRGMLSLLPLEDVDFHVRALSLGGVDLLRGTGDAASYPLVTRLVVASSTGRHNDQLVHTAEAALTATLPAPLRMLATGDIIPARCVYERQRRYDDYRHAFLEVAPTLRAADLTIGSLDASISDKGTPIGCVETFSLMAPGRSIEGITFAGIGLLTVAANHAKDCGESACGDLAFLDTLDHLDAAGVAHTGGGRTLAEARSPTLLTVKGVGFAFLGYDDIGAQYYGAGERSPGTAPLDLKTLGDDVRVARSRADVVVVMVHWGTEYTPDPTDRQRQAARIAVDAGATLVVGNHPHVVQAVESFPNGFADYALGNFVFDQDWSQETLEGVVMETVFDGPRLRQVAFMPLRIQDMHQPHFVTKEQGRSILNRMEKASLLVAGPGQ